MRSCGVLGEIVWLFREDIIPTGGKYGPDLFRAPNYHVKIGQTRENEEHARRYYKIGQDKGLGVALIAFISIGDAVGCRIEIPKDELGGEYKMIPIGVLKQACVENMREAAITTSPVKWRFLKFFSKSSRDDLSASLPSKT